MLTSINDLFDKFLHSLTGVWIGTHIEIVRTSQYEIVFERNPSIDPLYRSALYAIRFENNQLRKTLIGLCEYYAATDSFHYSIHLDVDRHVYSFGSETAEPYANQSLNYLLQQSGTGVTAAFRNFKEVYEENELSLLIDDKVTHLLKKDEDLEVINVRTDPLPLSQSTIQDCLVSWRTGTAVGKSYASPDKINPYVEITTKQHAYVFSISHDMVYCRAARYAACEKGMVFAQNIRISQIEKYGKQAYMLPDNTLALEPLIIKPDYFDFDTCTVTPEEEGGKMAGIYWSVKDQSDHLIVLHGCRGDHYYFPRVRKDLVEFFS